MASKEKAAQNGSGAQTVMISYLFATITLSGPDSPHALWPPSPLSRPHKENLLKMKLKLAP
jgi:hypothetical protein